MWFIISFCISIIILVMTVFYTLTHPKKRLLSLTVGTYAMLFVLLFPLGIIDGIEELIRNIFLTLVEAAKVFGLNSSFATDIDLFNTSGHFAWIYSFWLSLLYVMAPLLTASFLLTISHRTRNWVKWKFNLKKEVWIISEPSDKALLLAGSVLKKEKENVCIVFCDPSGKRTDQIADIGAISAAKKIDELDEAYFGRKPATLFFITNNDERNLEDLLNFVRKKKNDLKKQILIYCFVSSPAGGFILNAIAQKEKYIKFRRIAENKAVVYQELLKVAEEVKEIKSIKTLKEEFIIPAKKEEIKETEATKLEVRQEQSVYEGISTPQGKNAENEESDKKVSGEPLHILIVGCGWIGSEMLKALLWCFVRYDLVIDVIDKEDVGKAFFRSCPGLLSEHDILKERYSTGYEIRFHNNKDIRTFDISKDIDNAADIDFAFVALGNDIVNLECAVYLREAFRRLHRKKGISDEDIRLQQPKMHVVINDPGNNNLDLRDHETSLAIRPFIQGQEYYTAKTLLDCDLEKDALLYHLCWDLIGMEDKKKGISEEKDQSTIKKKFRMFRISINAWRIDRTIRKILSKKDNDDNTKNRQKKHTKHAEWRKLILKKTMIADFYESDYNSWSSRARAVFDSCEKTNGYKKLDPEIEHKRWILYMLTEGYEYGEKKDYAAKLHNDIRAEDSNDKDLRHSELIDKYKNKRRSKSLFSKIFRFLKPNVS